MDIRDKTFSITLKRAQIVDDIADLQRELKRAKRAVAHEQAIADMVEREIKHLQSVYKSLENNG